MAKLDGLNAALDNQDVATTGLASNATALVAEVQAVIVRVQADDFAPGELEAALNRVLTNTTTVSDAAAAISGAATAAAGIEPTPIVVPDPVEEIPPIEPPVEEPVA